jgi:glycosyltransferase involved in cell wall biosynthesis
MMSREFQVQISAVIPTYNRCDIVGRAIKSALAQEYPPFEVIVVDDGSTDGTRKVIESYGERVRCVYQANGGVSAARNRGVQEARSEWIAFLDSDDYWVPKHLSRIADAINATRGEAVLYFANMQLPSDEDAPDYWWRCGFEVNGEFEFRRDAGEWALLRIQPMMLQASVIRRTAYWEIGGLPEQLRTREDTLLFFKLGLLYPLCAVSGCGTIMNADGDVRLSRAYDTQSLVYCDATIFLYRDLLDSLKRIDRERRQFLMDSLAAAYFSSGRVFLGRKNYWSAIRSLGSSCFTSQSVFVREFIGSLARRVSRRRRNAVVRKLCGH